MNRGRKSGRKKRAGDGAAALRDLFRQGVRLHQAGKISEARGIYLRILEADPDHPDATHLLGAIACQTGEYERARDLIAKALAIDPGNAEAHCNLGHALQELGRLEDAVSSYRRALAIEPGLAGAHGNLGNALKKLGRLEDAVASYRQALSLKPDYVEALNNLGNALQELGRLEDAVASYRQALSLEPGYAKARRHLANTRKHDAHDDDIKAMEDLYGRPGLGDDHKMHLAFGLGKAYEDLEQYGKAFEFFLEGNRLKRKTFSYDVSREEGKLCRLREAFRATFVRGLGAAGNRSKVPIFVLGMPRSGTSLVEQILSSHADVFGAGELTLVEDTCAGHEGAGDKPWPERVCDFKDEDFHRCGSEYLSALRKQSPPARHIIDMMPGNFERTGFIRLMLPSARIIHVRRHPLDTCFSIFANYFAAHHPYAYDLRELGTYYQSYYEASMAHFRRALAPF